MCLGLLGAGVEQAARAAPVSPIASSRAGLRRRLDGEAAGEFRIGDRHACYRCAGGACDKPALV